MKDETYRTIIEQIAQTKSSTLTVFADFCRIAACCFAMGSREDEYFEAIKPYSKDELLEISKAVALLIKEMEEHPFTDVLGTYYLDIASHSAKQARGEFYTPPEVSKAMAMMLVDVETVKAKGVPITVSDPACGAGGIVLALAELFAPDAVDLLRFTCQDINPVGVDMCYINTSLWGIPATIIRGDTLRMTCDKGWKNIHWMRVGEDQRQAFKRMIDFIREPLPETNNDKVEPSQYDPSSHQVTETGQFEFDLTLESPIARSR